MITKILKKGKNSTISSLFAGIVVIMAMFMTVACEKDETSVADQQQTVRKPQPISDMEVMQYLPEVVDGRLVFKTIQDYETTIELLASIGDDNFEKWENHLSFCSMRSRYTLDELEEIGIYDPLFACLINYDGIIQIENYVYEIDILNSKVQVQPAFMYPFQDKFDEKACLEFSTDDNVLYIMSGEEKVTTEKSYCDSQNTGWYTWNCPAGSVQYRNRYFVAGIYYSLVARVEPSGSGVTGAISTTTDKCYYTNSKGDYTFNGETEEKTANENLRAYNGTRRLTQFYYEAKFLLRDVGHPEYPVAQPVAVISCN
jgi:hypothetical protein